MSFQFLGNKNFKKSVTPENFCITSPKLQISQRQHETYEKRHHRDSRKTQKVEAVCQCLWRKVFPWHIGKKQQSQIVFFPSHLIPCKNSFLQSTMYNKLEMVCTSHTADLSPTHTKCFHFGNYELTTHFLCYDTPPSKKKEQPFLILHI